MRWQEIKHKILSKQLSRWICMQVFDFVTHTMSTIGSISWMWARMDVARVKRRYRRNKTSLKGDKTMSCHDTVKGSDVLRKRVKRLERRCETRMNHIYCFAPRNRRQLRLENGASETADTELLMSYWWVEIWPHSGRTSKERELRYLEFNSILKRKPA